MKKALLLSVVLVCCASMAFAQGGSIGLFADAAGADCNIADVAPGGLCSVFVVHVNVPGATGSEWAITSPTCIAAPFLSDGSPFGVYIGASPFLPSGKSVGYGVCLAGPIQVATLNYFCQGLTGPCCLQSVVAHGINGGLVSVDCGFVAVPATGGTGIWNADTSCNCNVAAHTTTWGGVKSMFQ